jgi:hypothetical protein
MLREQLHNPEVKIELFQDSISKDNVSAPLNEDQHLHFFAANFSCINTSKLCFD